jgi:hypothetical protein
MADLSNTSEYAKYQHLEKVYLGDSVTALDYKHNISAVERIVSITYDCIKKVNAVVEIGVASSSLSDILKTDAGGSVAGGFDTSVIENTLTTHTNELARLDREKQDELIAGDNIEIINNVISATGGGQGLRYFVETQDSLYGNVDNKYNGISRNGDVGLFAGGEDANGLNAGFKAFVDGKLQLYSRVDGMSGDAGYEFTQAKWAKWTSYTTSSGYLYRKANNKKALIAQLRDNASYGDISRFVIASREQDAILWEWAECKPSDDPLTPTTNWSSYTDYPLTPSHYSSYQFGWQTTTVTYNGETWYIMAIQPPYSEGQYEQILAGDIIDHQDGTYYSNYTVEQLGTALLEIANAKNYVERIVSLGTEGKIFEYIDDGQEIHYINDDGSNSFETPIEVNPSGTATETMTSIEVNGVIYNIASGTQEQADWNQTDTTAVDYIKNKPSIPEIEANPSDTASETLSKLEIDGTVYGIPSGGGGSFYKKTTAEYNALPLTDKIDPTKLYFIDDGTEHSTELDPTQWNNTYEASMRIAVTNDKLTYTWYGSTDIGANSVYTVAIPASVNKIKFKITTGTCYSTSITRFLLGIGVRTTLSQNTIILNGNVSDWLVFKDHNTNNDVWEDELDLSNVDVDTYLYLLGHGWNLTVDSLQLVTGGEGEPNTCIYYLNTKYADSSNNASDVTYDNTQSGMTATDVQGAIDELMSRIQQLS